MDTSGPSVAELIERGLGEHRAGRLDEAFAAYRQALAIEPADAEALHLLGVALHQAGRGEEAVGHIRRAIALHSDRPHYHNNLGVTLTELGRLAEAEADLRACLRLAPGFANAHYNLGNLLDKAGRPSEAEASYREALRLAPDYPDALNNLGHVLNELGRPAEAEERLREALRLRPDSTGSLNNLGIALYDQGRLEEAEAVYRQALRLEPEFPDAHNNLAYALLKAGRFAEGWEEHEWRWRAKHMAPGVRPFSAPLWGGEPIEDKVILLHAEQGLGDTLQFCRYAPLVRAAVVLEVQAPLVRLLSKLPGVRRVIARGEDLPPFDLHAPLLSLPRAFGSGLETIPAATPYLAADAEAAGAWKARLASLPGLKVGLVWAGGPRTPAPELAAIDARRSIALGALAPLAEIPGVSFVSLQKGEPAAQAAHPPAGMALADFTDELSDFADTAALIDALDLVISVDTSVAHLTGALGRPVWLLNRFDACWRWLKKGDDSAWYPSLRQFRQTGPGDWPGVVAAARDALGRLAAGDLNQLQPRQA
jgi:Flp pilus assembly protein TadD